MRGTDIQGRFTVDFEAASLWEGVRDELASPVGVEVLWYQWDEEEFLSTADTVLDDVYDISSSTPGGGRVWKAARSVPVVTAQIYQGQIAQNDRGFYNTDTMRVVINVEDALRFFPNILTEPDAHIKDRIVFRNEVFTPIRVNPRGHMNYMFAVVTIDCLQVNPEELVNDPQFQAYAGENDPLSVLPPGPPVNVVAVADTGAATVTWDPPEDSGGSSIRSYMVATSDGSMYKNTTSTSASFLGLSGSRSYQFRVIARNRVGAGSASNLSAAVIPL